MKSNYYRPQRSCEGYVFTRVCDSVHRGGVLSQHALQVVSQHALQQGEVCSGGVPARGGVCLLEGGSAPGGTCSGGVGGGGRPPRKQTATVADGTHPTGMHSCFLNDQTGNTFISSYFPKKSTLRMQGQTCSDGAT